MHNSGKTHESNERKMMDIPGLLAENKMSAQGIIKSQHQNKGYRNPPGKANG
jgi:hypothetical protein